MQRTMTRAQNVQRASSCQATLAYPTLFQSSASAQFTPATQSAKLANKAIILLLQQAACQ